MIIIEKNEGVKIPYEITGKKICFDDDLTINLSKREEDWAVHIDVCFGEDDELVIGAAAGRRYVAEVDIPKRVYIEEPIPEEERGDEHMGGDTRLVPVPLDMDTVTLTLWALE